MAGKKLKNYYLASTGVSHFPPTYIALTGEWSIMQCHAVVHFCIGTHGGPYEACAKFNKLLLLEAAEVVAGS